jgi:voltage-gated potassium channel
VFFFENIRRDPPVFIAFDCFLAFVATVQVTVFSVRVARERQTSAADRSVVWVSIINGFSTIVLAFSTIYWTIGTKANFGMELSRVDAIYFALGTLTTAGTGTIVPTSGLARAIVSGQMIVDFVFVAAAVTIAITRWSEKSS